MSCLSCYFFLSCFLFIYAFLFQFHYKVELSHHTYNPLHTWLCGTWWFSFCFSHGLLSDYLHLSLLTISFMLKFSSEFFISIIPIFLSTAFLFGCICHFYIFTSFAFCSYYFLTWCCFCDFVSRAIYCFFNVVLQVVRQLIENHFFGISCLLLMAPLGPPANFQL